MKYSEFYEEIKGDISSQAISYYKYVVEFFYKHKDQKNLIVVEEDIIGNEDVKSCFNGFNISFGMSMANVHNYIAFIDPNKDPLTSFGEFRVQYLPEGKVPTHVFIMSEDPSVIDDCYKQLLVKYPDLKLTQVTYTFNPQEERVKRLKAIIKDDTKILYIEKYCSDLVLLYSEHKIDFIKEFERTVQEIMTFGQNKYVVYAGDYESRAYTTIYPLILCELYLRGAKCKYYVDESESLIRALDMSASLFNPDMMLVEDVATFLMNLPKLVASVRGPLLTFHKVMTKTLFLSTSYVPLNNLKGKVEKKVLTPRDIQIVPYSVHYNMETDDFQQNLSTELECRKFLNSLYDVFDVPKDSTLTVLNTFFFIKDGIEYVGYCRKMEFKANTLAFMMGQKPAKVTLNFDDIRRVLYLDLLLNLKSVLGYLQGLTGKNDLNKRSVIPYRVMRPGSNILFKYRIQRSDGYDPTYENPLWSDMSQSVFLHGMCSNMAVTTRVSVYKTLASAIGVDKSRNMLDSFGSFNLITNKEVHIGMDELS